MKQYAVWQAPFYSFWSRSFYADVAKNWRGFAYGYLFAVICFTWIFLAIKKQLDMNYYADHDFYPIVEQMPKVMIEKGVVSIDRPSPYILNNRNGDPVITFDTRQQPVNLAQFPGFFLVTKDGIYCKPKNENNSEISSADLEKQKLDLSTVEHAVIDRNVAHEFISDLCKSIGIIVFMFAVPLAFILCALQTLFYALIGKTVARIGKTDLSYGTLIRLSAVALTPVLLIDSIIKVRGIEFEPWTALSLGITIAYVIFAVSSNIANQNNNEDFSNF